MFFSIFLLLTVSKKWKMIIGSILVILVLLLVGLLINHSSKINHIVSISPDLKHVFVIKENTETGQSTYYRTSYGIFARPKENLPYKTDGEFKMKWLEEDVAAVTYKATDNKIHQYIGTYGDRNGGSSYSYVGPSIHGQWEGDKVRVTSASEGITIDNNGEIESYDWENIVQFGTIAIVLTKYNAAKWTIALNGNFKSNLNELISPSGEITVYKATMYHNEPITLEYVSSE